jgi:hypothetical protein
VGKKKIQEKIQLYFKICCYFVSVSIIYFAVAQSPEPLKYSL